MKVKLNSEKLTQLGFSRKEIGTAKTMERAGLFEIEPSDDLVDRTIERCAALLRDKVMTDDVPVVPTPLRLAESYVVAVKELSPALLKSAEWNQFARLQDLQQACLATANFAQSRRERPFVMLDNHNLVDPSWWNSDTGFRAFRSACHIASKVAAESGVLPAACLVVLRPQVDSYSDSDLAAIEELLRSGTCDLWWLPYQQAGRYKMVDFIVLGDERTWELNQRSESPAKALDAFRESINPAEANRVRKQLLKDLAGMGTQILTEGHLTASAEAQLKTRGVRTLLGNVMSRAYASVGSKGY